MKIPAAIFLILSLPGLSHAATVLIGGSVQNGDFENSGTGTVTFASGGVASWLNWTEQQTASNDTGVYTNQGDRTTYIQPGGAIRNLSSYLALPGDVFSYSFTNELAGRSAATLQLVYDNGGVITGIPGTGISGGPTNTYTGSFTVQAGDPWAGRAIGVGMFTAGNYPEVDDVTLEVVPETTVSLLGVLGAAPLLRRRRA